MNKIKEAPSDNNIYRPVFKKTRGQIYRTAYVTIALVIINVLVYLASNSIAPNFYDDLILDPAAFFYTDKIEWYRLITATFMHADVDHIFGNMLCLVAIGALLENYMGHGLYFIMYSLAGIAGNVLTLAYNITFDEFFGSLGASGCTMGLSGFMVVWLIVNRDQLVKEENMLINILLFGLLIVYECFFQKDANTVAHLGGCIIGVIFGIVNIIVFHNSKEMEGLL
ncbi:rhomboid family intramembrane serine protease [Butyrivibrio sp. WCD2001]|uniref:rhomboid family intramembrane serine protease n=1 Tax=Butyrivibrio sp. WCD2001 TaxID=1280681 RepID=UPI0003F9155F|nr:rhomboid family intramembrane serine protease [Butyrivibrio sp. WCD2001]